MPSYRFNSKHMAYAKQCSCCKKEFVGTKDEDESYTIFIKDFAVSNGSAQAADGLQSRCRVCNCYGRRSLGITLEWLRDMHQYQEGCCAICSVPISLDRNSANPADVDHDHTIGKIRQLLCGNCNRGVGLFFDNPQLLREAADYIEYWTKEHSND